jgi:cell division protease FtsH
VFGDLTTGAESDIQHLTRIARYMVGRWGMSEAIGPIAVLPQEGQSMLLPGVSETSEKTQQLVDDEVHQIVDTAHREVLTLLGEHRTQLDDLVDALLKHETLDQADAYAAAGLTRDESGKQPSVEQPATDLLGESNSPLAGDDQNPLADYSAEGESQLAD